MPETMTLALSCPSCGAKLEITPDIERFVCLHCGTQQIVRRGGGLISLQPFVQGIERVQYGTDRTAAELAIRRLNDEIAEARKDLEELEFALLDAIVPPPWKEWWLPALTFLAVIVVSAMFASTNKNAPTVSGFAMILIGPICLFWFMHARANRLGEARTIKMAQAKIQSDHIEKLQQEVERNRRTVSA